MNDLFTGGGSFPLYFKKPESSIKPFDSLGFHSGFCRQHESGLTFYIHRAKNTKESKHFGITPLCFTDKLNELKVFCQNNLLNVAETSFLNQPTLEIEIAENKKIIVQTKSFFQTKNILADISPPESLNCKNYSIIKTRNLEKATEWYVDFLGTQTISINQQHAISMFKEDFIIVHELETNKNLIGPPGYKSFGIKSSNIYKTWDYLKSKGKINNTWLGPKMDGPWRFIDVRACDGYIWRIYAQINIYSESEIINSKLLTQKEISQLVHDKSLDSLPQKYLAPDQKEEIFLYEDQIINLISKMSPYGNLEKSLISCDLKALKPTKLTLIS